MLSSAQHYQQNGVNKKNVTGKYLSKVPSFDSLDVTGYSEETAASLGSPRHHTHICRNHTEIINRRLVVSAVKSFGIVVIVI